MSHQKLRDAPVIRKLPHRFGRNKPVPKDLEGATIVQVGTLRDSSLVEGGGLVIDYRPAGAERTRRAILAFDETAMWLESVLDHF